MPENELPTAERSLKFMAWDIKKMKESCDEIGIQLRQLNQTLSKIAGIKSLPPATTNGNSRIQSISEFPQP